MQYSIVRSTNSTTFSHTQRHSLRRGLRGTRRDFRRHQCPHHVNAAFRCTAVCTELTRGVPQSRWLTMAGTCRPTRQQARKGRNACLKRRTYQTYIRHHRTRPEFTAAKLLNITAPHHRSTQRIQRDKSSAHRACNQRTLFSRLVVTRSSRTIIFRTRSTASKAAQDNLIQVILSSASSSTTRIPSLTKLVIPRIPPTQEDRKEVHTKYYHRIIFVISSRNRPRTYRPLGQRRNFRKVSNQGSTRNDLLQYLARTRLDSNLNSRESRWRTQIPQLLGYCRSLLCRSCRASIRQRTFRSQSNPPPRYQTTSTCLANKSAGAPTRVSQSPCARYQCLGD